MSHAHWKRLAVAFAVLIGLAVAAALAYSSRDRLTSLPVVGTLFAARDSNGMPAPETGGMPMPSGGAAPESVDPRAPVNLDLRR
ncbi:MAG: hypothetical protein AB7N65_23640, partial [Vicinamibacterales bacterium]